MEAHPTDGWDVSGDSQPFMLKQPVSNAEKLAAAKVFAAKTGLNSPIAIDSIENKAARLYAGMPDRLLILDPNGIVELLQKPGPFDYLPADLREHLQRLPVVTPSR